MHLSSAGTDPSSQHMMILRVSLRGSTRMHFYLVSDYSQGATCICCFQFMPSMHLVPRTREDRPAKNITSAGTDPSTQHMMILRLSVRGSTRMHFLFGFELFARSDLHTLKSRKGPKKHLASTSTVDTHSLRGPGREHCRRQLRSMNISTLGAPGVDFGPQHPA